MGEDCSGSAEDKDEADWRQRNASWYIAVVKSQQPAWLSVVTACDRVNLV